MRERARKSQRAKRAREYARERSMVTNLKLWQGVNTTYFLKTMSKYHYRDCLAQEKNPRNRSTGLFGALETSTPSSKNCGS